MPQRRAERRGKKTVKNPDVTKQPATPATSAPASGCGDGVKLWRADRTEIKLVNCPKGPWPEADEDGKTAYSNTHFPTAEQAWDKVEREIEARVQLNLSAINRATTELERLKDELVTASLDGLKAKENRQNWNRHNAPGEPPAREKEKA